MLDVIEPDSLMQVRFVVSRKWNNPEIKVYVNDKEIGVEVDLLTFIDCLVRELNPPRMFLTKGHLDTQLRKSVQNIIQEMKRATDRV